MIEPFSTVVDLQAGTLRPADRIIRRNLSDMALMYADIQAANRILKDEGDRLIYEVHAVNLPEAEGMVLYSTTIIQPGRIGDEYHMTKGHFHAKRDRAELYLGLSGHGFLVLQSEQGAVRGVPMQSGTIAYVPPLWAHRTVNVGNEPFSFLAVWPGDAGHDYGTIEQTGFAQCLVDRNGQPIFVDCPHRTYPRS